MALIAEFKVAAPSGFVCSRQDRTGIVIGTDGRVVIGAGKAVEDGGG